MFSNVLCELFQFAFNVFFQVCLMSIFESFFSFPLMFLVVLMVVFKQAGSSRYIILYTHIYIYISLWDGCPPTVLPNLEKTGNVHWDNFKSRRSA